MLLMCVSRKFDGLWVGTIKDEKAGPILRRVEEALSLIKRYDPLQFARVLHSLDRIWVNILPDAPACFQRSLQACVFDERFVLAATTTPETIAKTIVHEATHARLEHWGIRYDEKDRTRIEAICLRRELAFVANLPASEPLREELDRTLQWCADNPNYFSNLDFYNRDVEGRVAALRYLGTPDWLIRLVSKANAAISTVRRRALRLLRPAKEA